MQIILDVKNTSKGIYKLGRIVSVAGLAIPFTSLGVFAATTRPTIAGTIQIFVANFLCTLFAFMINDVEDAEEDAHDPVKKLRNPISAKIITKKTGYTASALVGVLSLLIFATMNTTTLLIGILNLALGFIYSWKKIRLKATPVADVLSHAFYLGTGLVATGFSALTNNIISSAALLPLVIATLISIWAEINQEIRDFEVDTKTNIDTTVTLLGKKLSIAINRVLFVIYTIASAYYLFSIRGKIYVNGIIFIAPLVTLITLLAAYKKKEKDLTKLWHLTKTGTAASIALSALMVVSAFLA